MDRETREKILPVPLSRPWWLRPAVSISQRPNDTTLLPGVPRGRRTDCPMLAHAYRTNRSTAERHADHRLVRCFCAHYSFVIRLRHRFLGRSLLRSRIPRPRRALSCGNGPGHRFSGRGFCGYEFFRSRLLRCGLPRVRRLRHRFAVAFDQKYSPVLGLRQPRRCAAPSAPRCTRLRIPIFRYLRPANIVSGFVCPFGGTRRMLRTGIN